MNRPHTSERQVKDLRWPDRRTAMKALVRKTYVFVDRLWAVYVQSNKADLRYVTKLFTSQYYPSTLVLQRK